MSLWKLAETLSDWLDSWREEDARLNLARTEGGGFVTASQSGDTVECPLTSGL